MEELDELGADSAGWLAFLISQVGAFAAQRFAEHVRVHELTPAHAGLLRAVGLEEGRSQQALSVQLGLLPSRLVGLVDELERAGLLERRRSTRDRRLHELYLSPAGIARANDVTAVSQVHGEQLLAVLDGPERAVLRALLDRLAYHHGMATGVHPGYRELHGGREPEPPTPG